MATLGQRVDQALKALVGLFTGLMPGGVGERMLSGLFPGISGTVPLAGTRERIGAFASTPWLHAVADKVASAFASVEWQAFVVRRAGGPTQRARALQKAGREGRRKLLGAHKQARELVPLESNLLLDTLDAANPYHTGVAMRKVWMLHYDLAGDAFLVKERNGLGAPMSLWPMSPNWVLATPTPGHRAFRVGFRGWQGEIPDTEVLWISNPNPEQPYGRGVGMAQALADEIETDEYAAKLSRQTFLNQARPDFIVYPKEGQGRAGWSEPETRRIEEAWRGEHQGFWRAFKPKFASRELGVYEFQETSFRNLQMVQLREFERSVILQTWGIPPELLGLLESSNRATIAAAAYLFSRWVLVPRLEVFRAAIQERLVPEYDEKIIVDYVDPVEEDPALEVQALTAAPWAALVDEWRHRQGLPPLPDNKGQVHLVPFQLQAVEDFADAVLPTPSPGALPPPGARGLARLSEAELMELRRLRAKLEAR